MFHRSSEGLADLLSNNLPPISETTSPKPQKTAPIQSPTSVLTSQFSHTLTVKSPHNDASMNPILNPALLKFTSQRLQSTNHGLNSILDRSPAAVVPRKKQKKIRRQSLSQYYGRSVDSPNLREVPGELISVRRSPRLASECTVPCSAYDNSLTPGHFMKMSSHFHFAKTCFTLLGIEIMSSMA